MFNFFRRKKNQEQTLEHTEDSGLQEDSKSVDRDILEKDSELVVEDALEKDSELVVEDTLEKDSKPVGEDTLERDSELVGEDTLVKDWESVSEDALEKDSADEFAGGSNPVDGKAQSEHAIANTPETDSLSQAPETEMTQTEERTGYVEGGKNGEEISSNEAERVEEPKKGFFARLKAGLEKTRNSITQSFDNLFKSFSTIDDDFYEELEETLIMADLGLDTTDRIIEELKVIVKKNHIKEVEACRELVINLIREQMFVDESAYDFEEQKTVMLIIGVNGVGKTTSIGKLAAQYKKRGRRVMMCAADTFRAAAIDQLKTWADRAGVEIIAQKEGSDPAAVTFDAVKAAAARNVDILLVDTAGRLHNKKNLMDELAKMKRIIEKEYSDAHLETLIVLDGSTGQNALEQAKQFSTVTDIDGIILTKLDGTAKGGIAIAIQSELNVPVKYIGVGEQIDDLQRFNPETYVNALFADMDTRSDIEILIPKEEE